MRAGQLHIDARSDASVDTSANSRYAALTYASTSGKGGHINSEARATCSPYVHDVASGRYVPGWHCTELSSGIRFSHWYHGIAPASELHSSLSKTGVQDSEGQQDWELDKRNDNKWFDPRLGTPRGFTRMIRRWHIILKPSVKWNDLFLSCQPGKPLIIL